MAMSLGAAHTVLHRRAEEQKKRRFKLFERPRLQALGSKAVCIATLIGVQTGQGMEQVGNLTQRSF